MSEEGLAAARQKMTEAGVDPVAIEVFTSYYHQLETGDTGLIREDTISPLTNPPMLDDVEVSEEQAAEALDKTVIIKLNGGLGTSMGLDRAKSLLEVRDGKSFLDIIATQVLSARKTFGARLPLMFMNSFNTREDTLKALEKYPELAVDGLELDFLQDQEPKLDAETLAPVEWPKDSSLEWCPPGHGDLYTALLGSGVLDHLDTNTPRYPTVTILVPFRTVVSPAGLRRRVLPTLPSCAVALLTTRRVATWPFVSLMISSSCAIRHRQQKRKWITSPTSIVTPSSTPTICGLTLKPSRRCWTSDTA